MYAYIGTHVYGNAVQFVNWSSICPLIMYLNFKLAANSVASSWNTHYKPMPDPNQNSLSFCIKMMLA